MQLQLHTGHHEVLRHGRHSRIIVNGALDTIFPLESARREFEVARRLYAQAGAPDKVRHVIGPEGHRFYAALTWPVFDELTNW